MLIRCTKKLLDELKIKPETTEEVDPLFSWHANTIMLNRRKVVVLVNDKNRYGVVLYGLKANDFKKFEEIALQGIRAIFHAAGIKDEVINQYMLHSKGTLFTKSKDRTCVARLNKACESAYVFEDLLDVGSMFQPELSNHINHDLVGNGKNSYIVPNEEMVKDLKSFAGQSIFDSKAVVLKVTLRLQNHNVWRRLVVPVNKTFTQLHQILQEAFGWQDYHMHDFLIFDKLSTQEVPKPIVNLVCHEESVSYPGGVDMKLETGVKLSDYIPAYDKLMYTYDFGDDWHHDIEVEQIEDDYEYNIATCIAGEGSAPPEDVGGEPGYDNFMKILENPNDADHAHMVEWSRKQGYQDFNINSINYALKHL